jgi:hypothetical protein
MGYLLVFEPAAEPFASLPAIQTNQDKAQKRAPRRMNLTSENKITQYH